jgi:hypothetical protein
MDQSFIDVQLKLCWNHIAANDTINIVVIKSKYWVFLIFFNHVCFILIETNRRNFNHKKLIYFNLCIFFLQLNQHLSLVFVGFRQSKETLFHGHDQVPQIAKFY